MKTRIIVALLIAQVLLVRPGAAEAQVSRFDGRWQNEDGGSPLRWVDVRVIENGPSFLVWWSCGRPDGCMFNGRVNAGPDGAIEVIYAEPQGKSLLRISEGNGTLFVREEMSWADGRVNRAVHRMHRIPTTVSAPLPDVVVGRGRIGVRTAGGGVQEVQPPNPRRQAPRPPPGCRESDPGLECQRLHYEVQMLTPPYSPDDPNGNWVRLYNNLLGQILFNLLRPRPDLLDSYMRSESFNDYDRFVRRSEFIDYLTRPQP